MKTVKELKEVYQYGPGMYLPKEGELLKLIGTEVVILQYSKSENGYESQKKTAILHQMGNFDLNTITYQIQYSMVGSNIIETSRITPDGFEYAPQDESSERKNLFRITPLSLLSKQIEEEHFISRLEEIFNQGNPLSEEMIMAFSKAPGNNNTVLDYCYNIMAIMKFPDDTFGYFKVTTLGLTMVTSENALITIGDKSSQYHIPVTTNSDLIYQSTDIDEKPGDVIIRLFDLGNM